MTAQASGFVEDAGFLLSNLLPKHTGVTGSVIWFAAGEYSRTDSQYGPRIQVALGDRLTLDGLADSVAVLLTNPPRVLGTLPNVTAAQVVTFVERNRIALLEYWDGEMATSDVIERIVRA